MKRDQAHRFWRSAAQSSFGLVALALLTWVSFQLGLNLTTTACAYLTLIVLLSLTGSFMSLVVLGFVAVACLNYFFTKPIFAFQVNYREDLAELIAFLVTSWVVAGLVRRSRGLAQTALDAGRVSREQAQLLDLTHDTIFVSDMSDVITYWNRGAEELYGWTREEVLGKVTHQLLETIFPEPLQVITATLLRTGRWEGELVHTKRDGTQVTVASRWSLQRDEDGKPVATLETNNDVSAHRQSEESLRKSQAELARVTRVTTLGELAASIAHEVNQPIAGVVTNANACLRWLGRDLPDLDEARAAAQRIVRDGNRASEVIARIRALVGKTGTAKERLDVNGAIRDVLALTKGEARRARVTLRTELAGELPPVLADRVQVQQVMLNLITNGIEAMSTVADRPRVLIIRTERGQDDVRVAVQDSGVGLDAESAKRIFDAFYTTKSGGMGIGLSISRSILEDHGGRLWAEPNDGPGATFQFTLSQHR